MSSYYRQSLENYLKTLDIKAERVLDVGGASNPVTMRVNSWDVKNYEIYDNCAEKAVTEYKDFDINFPIDETYYIDKIKKIPEDIPRIFDTFDVVFCLEVFEYVYNPVVAIDNIYEVLSDGGELYVTFPSLYPPHNPIEYDYMRYTKQGVVKLLQDFKIQEIIPREIHNKDLYKRYVDAERYKVKGAHEVGTLYDAGYIIKAVKL